MSGLTIIATTAGKAIFPLDKTWRLESSVSDSLSREVVRLAGWMAYEQVSQTLDRLGHVSVPAATVWTEAKRQGERLQAQDAGEQARVGVERVQWQDGRYDGKARKAISLDGGMVAVRGEGWKELKVGVVSEMETAASTEQQTVHLQQAHYTAVLGDSGQFKPALWALAWRQGVPFAGDSAVTADGALWIWRSSGRWTRPVSPTMVRTSAGTSGACSTRSSANKATRLAPARLRAASNSTSSASVVLACNGLAPVLSAWL